MGLGLFLVVVVVEEEDGDDRNIRARKASSGAVMEWSNDLHPVVGVMVALLRE